MTKQFTRSKTIYICIDKMKKIALARFSEYYKTIGVNLQLKGQINTFIVN